MDLRDHLDPVEIIKPIFEKLCLQDLLPTINEYLQQSVLQDERLNHIGKWEIGCNSILSDISYWELDKDLGIINNIGRVIGNSFLFAKSYMTPFPEVLCPDLNDLTSQKYHKIGFCPNWYELILISHRLQKKYPNFDDLVKKVISSEIRKINKDDEYYPSDFYTYKLILNRLVIDSTKLRFNITVHLHIKTTRCLCLGNNYPTIGDFNIDWF